MRLILILLIVFPLYTFSQEPVNYSEAIEVPNVEKNELFLRGREWFNDNFKSSKDVLQVIDKETGELSGKGFMEVVYTFRYMGERNAIADVKFQISVWVKDGKYKYELTNFYIPSRDGFVEFGLITSSNETNKTFPGYSAKKLNEMYLSIKQNTETKAKLLIEDLKLKMSKKYK